MPDKDKTLLDAMGAAFDATRSTPRRIRGMALSVILKQLIRGRARVARGDFETLLGDWIGRRNWRPSQMSQFFPSAQEIHTLAVRSRNAGAAGDLERYLGHAPWWWDGPSLEDLGRLRLFVGARIYVRFEGEIHPALVTQIGRPTFREADEVRLKIAPAGDCHIRAKSGFALRKLDREGFAKLLADTKGGNQ